MGEEIVLFDTFPFKKIRTLPNKGGWGNISLVKLMTSNELFIAKRPNIAFDIFEPGFDLNKIAIKKEAKILLTIPFHENVIDCFLVDSIKGITYIFMEYVDGGDLEDWIIQNKLPSWEICLIIIVQIIKGMIHIHNNAVVHADLKPSNILVSNVAKINEMEIPSIKISDFGLSKIFGIEKPNKTNLSDVGRRNEDGISTGFVSELYTPEYASPEQQIWKGQRIDKVSDIFSFGIIIAELVTSVLGFKKEIQYNELVKKNDENFSAKVESYILDKRKDIPKGLLRIILKSLNLSRNERYQSFEEILLDINTLKIPGIQIRNFKYSRVPAPETKILKYGLRGYSLTRIGYEEDARIQFKNSIEIDSSYTGSPVNTGLSYFDLGQYDKAIECYDKVLQSQDKIDKEIRIAALVNKGSALDRLGRYVDARICYDEALSLDHENLLALINKGQSFSDDKKYEKAIEYFNKALNLDVNNILANCNKGIALLLLGLYEQSINCFNKVLTHDRGYLRAYHGRSLALFNTKHYQEAINDFDKILSVDPGNMQVIRSKTIALFELGKDKESLMFCDKILAVSPNDIDILYIKGRIFTNFGKYEEELRLSNKILKIDPKNIPTLIRTSYVYGELGNYQKQKEYCEKTLEIDHNNIDALNNLGLAISGLNKPEESLKYFNKALDIKPDYILALNNKGATLLKLNRDKEALEFFKKALNINPFFGPSLLAKIMIEEQQGNFEEAIKDIDIVLISEPDSPYLLNRKGILLAKSGKIESAIEFFDRALEKDPTYTPAIDNKNFALSLRKI